MKISIIGGGYVGLVSAVCFADMGHVVTCIENDHKKYALLQSKEVPFLNQSYPKNYLTFMMPND